MLPGFETIFPFDRLQKKKLTQNTNFKKLNQKLESQNYLHFYTNNAATSPFQHCFNFLILHNKKSLLLDPELTVI